MCMISFNSFDSLAQIIFTIKLENKNKRKLLGKMVKSNDTI